MEHTEAEIDSVISRQNVSKEGWTTYYVDGANGNDANNFLRWESAAKTIQAAIDKAESWAKIYIKAGTYNEDITVDKSGIHLIGAYAATVIIKGSEYGIILNAEYCTVSKLTAIGFHDGIIPYNTAGIYIQADRCEVEDCFVGNQGATADADGLSIDSADRVTVKGVKIASGYVPGQGLRIDGATHCIIEENVIIGCAKNNILIRNSAQTAKYNHIRENTCDGNGASDYGIRIIAGPIDNFIYHNNFYDNTNNATDAVADVNHFFENYYSDHTTDINNDGLCDSPRTTGNVNDYSPVSKLNGWLQESLGMTPSSSITITNTFNLVNALLTLTETGGTLTTDGTVQDVYINETPAGVFAPKKVQIDFSNQTAAETVVIRESYRIKSGGGYIEKDAVTFAGVQSPLLKNVVLEENRFGVKVTLERTAGGIKTYEWGAIYKI